MSYIQGNTSTPLGIGRGRGRSMMLQFDSPVKGGVVHVMGGERVLAEATSAGGDRVTSQSHHTVPTPSTQVTATLTQNSVSPSPDVVSQMSDIIQHVGQQLADSIVARLSPAFSPPTPSTPTVHTAPANVSAHSLDLSHVQLAPHRKVKEPPTFRGDDSDTVDVHEWEDLMRDYIKRTNVKPEQQAEEMLIHLRGRAKDVVKVAMRNCGIDVTLNPDAIYAPLRRHFAAVPCSPLPLADFYTTLPKSNEGAYDYWLRLNQAADVAAGRLREQGKELHCPSLEVTRMFIKNCPSKELAMTFRSKTIDKWTAVEVQDVLDEYHTERGSWGAAGAVSRKPSENVYVNKVEVLHTVAPPPDSKDSHTPKSPDLAALERVITMLEKVLLERSTPTQANTTRHPRVKPFRIEGLNNLPCATQLPCAGVIHRICTAGKLVDLHQVEDGADPISVPPTGDIEDIESVFASACSSVPPDKTVIFQGTQRIQKSDSLFYTTVTAAGVSLKAMMDSGSTGCTLSVPAVQRLLQQNPDMRQYSADDVVIIGCGGHQVTPSAICDVEVEVYDCKMIIPMFVVPGQTDDMILGSNAIKTIIRLMRKTDGYWRLMSEPSSVFDEDCHDFFSLLSNTERWRGDTVPDKVGTLKLQRRVTLQPQSEHLVWGMLPASAPMSVGSTVVVEPTQARCRPRQVLVGRIVTPMWGDRCLPMKVINPTNEPIVLKRNTKLADVFPCVAAEDLSQPDHIQVHSQSMAGPMTPRSKEDVRRALDKLGLSDLDLDSCTVSDLWRDRLLQIIERHESIFSQDKMDCGEATDFVHKIHLVDEKPFRLPYRRVPPSHYEKLRTALNEMEEKGIIRKSSSEYASPLVLVWKKNGDLRICTDFRWLNARTVKDAHPLPHQADALAALGGNVFFSTMDLTSGFYNVPMHEDHKKYTAFSSPFGLHEYNRMPQGLSNSPATFMRMMLSIFGDENFTSLLCYLDDLLVFGPNEQIALERLEMVFFRLKNHNLKLAPKKCHFLRRSVKFLGHVISESGVQTDPGKVEAISRVQVSDLMDSDGVTPSQKKIRSFLGMVLYYQHFIEDCSAKARPLFKLLSEQKTGGKTRRKRMRVNKRSSQVKLSADDWTTGRLIVRMHLTL
ncbi:Retrovirus-related Pol polyprotein from transposon 17.6 [Merluccius polli]|uniref:ribonuclease H n=1 Tax=Merluccius polli TaxID=89951 RepID=A0AA47N5T1_MERPO|nr:Retrovirus-related Pol polyprotein from transposon 17.6 [Merluccius polli]